MKRAIPLPYKRWYFVINLSWLYISVDAKWYKMVCENNVCCKIYLSISYFLSPICLRSDTLPFTPLSKLAFKKKYSPSVTWLLKKVNHLLTKIKIKKNVAWFYSQILPVCVFFLKVLIPLDVQMNCFCIRSW